MAISETAIGMECAEVLLQLLQEVVAAWTVSRPVRSSSWLKHRPKKQSHLSSLGQVDLQTGVNQTEQTARQA